jgi:hypothetical protein
LSRLIPLCLCLMLLGLMGTNGYATKKVPQASSEQEIALRGQPGDVPEARELMKQAGARSVMVTLWNIPVEESLKFYRTFYQGLKDGKTRLQALQAARKSVRDKEPHPYFWSGIILHGEG